MNPKEIAEISAASGTIKWAEMVEASLQGDASSMHFSGKTNKRLDEIWVALRKEVHELLCTDSAKYDSERKAFTVTIKPAIAAIAALITKDYGFPIAAASSLSSLALLLPVRMVKEAWCAASTTKSFGDEEKKQLRKLIEENAGTGTSPQVVKDLP
jgi:hypothetical protein